MNKILPWIILCAGCGESPQNPNTANANISAKEFSAWAFEKFGPPEEDIASRPTSKAWQEMTVKKIHTGGYHVTINALELTLNKRKNLLGKRAGVKILTVNAASVKVNAHFHLPSGDITINAEKLSVKKNGVIDITPKHKKSPPTDRRDGENGKNAGKIVLNLEQLKVAHGKFPVFIARGGDGQPAAPGRNGKNGKSLPHKSDGTIYSVSCNAKFCSESGVQQWPENGQDAIPGGRPGNPGNGGIVASTVSEIFMNDLLLDISGGLAGKKAPDYIGGRGGKPRLGRHVTRGKVEVRLTRDGKDAPSPRADFPSGRQGKRIFLERQQYSWLRPGYVQMLTKYAQYNHIKENYQESQKAWLKLNAIHDYLESQGGRYPACWDCP